HVRDVVGDGALPLGGRADLAGGNEQELRLGIDEAADEPWTRDPVDPCAFTSDPSHDISPLAEQVFVLTLAGDSRIERHVRAAPGDHEGRRGAQRGLELLLPTMVGTDGGEEGARGDVVTGHEWTARWGTGDAHVAPAERRTQILPGLDADAEVRLGAGGEAFGA